MAVRALEPGGEDPGEGLEAEPGGVPVAEGVPSLPFLIWASAPPIFDCVRFREEMNNDRQRIVWFAKSRCGGEVE